jgi:hypothetical protein
MIKNRTLYRAIITNTGKMKCIILLITLASCCSTFGQKNESVFVNLTDKENWKITDNNYESNQHVILLANDKTYEHLSLTSSLGVKNSDLIKVMNSYYNDRKGRSKDTKLSLIEKDLNAKAPWIMYSIQNVTNEECNCTESQVWLLIQGDNCLHSCVMSIKNDLFTNEKKDEIIKSLKPLK